MNTMVAIKGGAPMGKTSVGQALFNELESGMIVLYYSTICSDQY